ncbi:MAG: hypothetical protein KJ060_10450 [Candidatus Hydrogenedentes bacterium]|nr:hypothetical protein [Candidatus Hydrogenedentota bacterium]
MGWGRLLLLGNVGQQLDLSDQKAEIDELRRELSRNRHLSGANAVDLGPVERDIRALQQENDELRLYLTAVVRLLVSKGAVSQDELIAIVNAVDSEDGLPNGRYSGNIV